MIDLPPKFYHNVKLQVGRSVKINIFLYLNVNTLPFLVHRQLKTNENNSTNSVQASLSRINHKNVIFHNRVSQESYKWQVIAQKCATNYSIRYSINYLRCKLVTDNIDKSMWAVRAYCTVCLGVCTRGLSIWMFRLQG